MNYPQPYLQKYKGKATRHTCPSCETKLSFTLYLNGDTHEPINSKVGKCNRESKCGYHYTPKQNFIDNPQKLPSPFQGEGSGVRFLKPPLRGGLVGSIPFNFVQKSASYRSNFVRFLCECLTVEQMTLIGENYALGATKNKEVIFWQIDITGKVRTGKIMQYNSETGRRIKHESGAIDWVHNKLKQKKQLPEDFNLQQCFFGEHLLKVYPDKPVAIVESEKSAIIASCIIPDIIWLAAGNLNGLSVEKCQVLTNRDVMLYPDLGAFEKWSLKAAEIQKLYECKITISSLLEYEGTDSDRANGLDIADFIITELISPLSSNSQKIEFLSPLGESPRRGKEVRVVVYPEIQSCLSPTLHSMIDKNKALSILINELHLEEI